MNRISILVAACAAVALSPTSSLRAGESLAADVQVVEVSDATFSVDILDAQWQQQEDGSFALAIAYALENRTSEPLATVGLSLAAETDDGTAKSFISRFRSCDLQPGDVASFALVVDEKSLGGFDYSDRVTLAGTSSSTQRCTGEHIDCNKIRFACEQGCNNPLGTNAGLGVFSCGNCRPHYDNQRQCWSTICNAICACNALMWPDQMPALVEFLDFDPLLDEAPVEPWPY